MNSKPVVFKTWEQWQQERKEFERKHPIQNWMLLQWYSIRRICEQVRNFPKEVKWWVQRANRGFSDSDVWSFDDYLCRIIKDGIDQLRKTKHGYPNGLTPEDWSRVLADVSFTFETQAKLINHDLVFYDEAKKRKRFYAKLKSKGINVEVYNKEQKKRYLLGWSYFRKYFSNFWD